MQNGLARSGERSPDLYGRSWRPSTILAITILSLMLQPGCFFRKKKARIPQYPASPIQIVLLPLTVPEGNTELRWVSLAAPIMMAKELENAKDLQAVPLWTGFPAAAEALGTSRSITAETAAYVASRVNARWAAHGEISPTKKGIELLIDFIPAKSSLIAYRYAKDTSIGSLDRRLREAFEQFLRYLAARPLEKSVRSMDSNQLREVASAIDREYGWFAAAEPGKAESTVASLTRFDDHLARLLFNPAIYGSPSSSAANPSKSSATEATAKNTPPTPPPERREAPTPSTSNPLSTKGKSGQGKPAAAPSPPSLPRPAPISRTESPPTKPATPAPTTPSKPPNIQMLPKPPPSPDVAEAPSSPRSEQVFYLQVFSSRSKADSEAKAAQLTKAGFIPKIVRADLKDRGIWYRIRLEIHGARKSAEAAGKKLVEDGLIGDYWLVP